MIRTNPNPPDTPIPKGIEIVSYTPNLHHALIPRIYARAFDDSPDYFYLPLRFYAKR